MYRIFCKLFALFIHPAAAKLIGFYLPQQKLATQEGFPLAYEVFAGNRADVTTVEEIVEIMESKYGRARRVWVMDRGMVSEDNLQFLRDRGGLYLVGTPRGMLKKFQAYLLDSN